MEEIILYILMFCIGSLFGSFFTLAVYRLPLHQDITHERSYCPNCKHKLGFFDMIPILSYIFLGGKCRYCKKKIRIRYLVLEVLTGTLFVIWTMSLNMNIFDFQTSKVIYLVVSLLYLAGNIIIAGIDKEKRMISKPVILYEIIILSTYMIYLYVVEKTNIYRYVIYLLIMACLLFIDNIYYRKKLKDNYTIDVLIFSIVMALFMGENNFLLTAIFTLLVMIIVLILKFIKNKANKHIKTRKENSERMPIGFYICCGNIIVTLFLNFFNM